MSADDTLVMILAGGEGKRLYPLTRDRAKPAVPFGGRYRIIDFVLSNFINSGFYKIKVLTQYKSDSLNIHISRGWALSSIISQFIDPVPAQMRTGEVWYKGTADAVYQNIHLIENENCKFLCVFSGDHIYKMNVRPMLKYHKQKKADMTISAIPIKIEDAHEYGIIEVDENWRLTGFVEKPKHTPKCIPGRPDMCLASMGNYIFNSKNIIKELKKDAKDNTSTHDFGKSLIPSMLAKGSKIYVYDFATNEFKGMQASEQGYWRDVGTIDAYWQANMDLLDYSPELNLYSEKWPLRTFNYNYPPAKFIWEENDRIGRATNSMISEGCVISGGTLSRCILSPNVRINSYSTVSDSIIMEDVDVGRHCEIRKAIIDKKVKIPPNTKIGVNKEDDLARGFLVSQNGITVVPKGAKL